MWVISGPATCRVRRNMKAHWTAFGVGILVGAALGFWMSGAKGGKPGTGITGSFAAPFQNKISRG